MRARRIVPATLVALLMVAASISGGPAAAKSAETAVRLTALDGSAQAQSRIVDGRTVVSTSRDGSDALSLAEPLQLRVVESGGARVALATPLADGADTYRPGGRASTRLVVADLDTGTKRAYDVPRNLEPEAFGVGASRDLLFVIDHRPALNPSSYRVGVVNLADGSFQGLLGPSKTPLDIDMTGYARQQVLSGTGTQLYTLYLEHDHAESASGTAFVHVLDLEGGWAYCVDLPGVGHGPAGSSTIRLNRSGDALIVTDRHADTRYTIQTADLALNRLGNGAPSVARRPLTG
jgi:hypothetical protein